METVRCRGNMMVWGNRRVQVDIVISAAPPTARQPSRSNRCLVRCVRVSIACYIITRHNTTAVTKPPIGRYSYRYTSSTRRMEGIVPLLNRIASSPDVLFRGSSRSCPRNCSAECCQLAKTRVFKGVWPLLTSWMATVCVPALRPDPFVRGRGGGTVGACGTIDRSLRMPLIEHSRQGVRLRT